jgi:hypothetical protein
MRPVKNKSWGRPKSGRRRKRPSLIGKLLGLAVSVLLVYYLAGYYIEIVDLSFFDSSTPQAGCHQSYAGSCLDPYASDYDCGGGGGDGPQFTGRVTIVGPDVFGLDRDGDGVGCG